VANHFDDYRAMEGELGIGPLPISINEYSGAEHIEDEGQPGASAPLIAKFERMGIDTACLTYWDVPHPGRLGTLLADDTNKNGGWWFYKWYGDMTGDMVDTIPAANNNVTTLDGFANLDLEERFASVLFAGENDGTIRVVVKGFSATGLFGDTVHAVVEQTPWVDRSTVVNATALLSEDDLTIADDEIEITVPNANNFDGYRIYLTSNEPVNTGTGGNGSGGGDGAGGSEGTGGGPVVSAGGATGTGGALGVGTGGAADASGGMAASPTGGMTSGGTDGGISSGGSSSGGSGDGVGPDDDSPETAGCSCRSSGGGPSSPTTMMMVLGLSGLIFSRRRRSSCSAISVS
jgi:MYXO-CTERM domain-containing protein